MHDPAHFGVNEAQVHTDSLTVRTKLLVLKSPPNLPEWGHNSGKRLKMVDFGNLCGWCEQRAFPCKRTFRKCSPTPQIEQGTRVALGCSSLPRLWAMAAISLTAYAVTVSRGAVAFWAAPSSVQSL